MFLNYMLLLRWNILMILNSRYFDKRLVYNWLLRTLWVGNPRDKGSLPATPPPKCRPSCATAVHLFWQLFAGILISWYDEGKQNPSCQSCKHLLKITKVTKKPWILPTTKTNVKIQQPMSFGRQVFFGKTGGGVELSLISKQTHKILTQRQQLVVLNREESILDEYWCELLSVF